MSPELHPTFNGAPGFAQGYFPSSPVWVLGSYAAQVHRALREPPPCTQRRHPQDGGLSNRPEVLLSD